MGSRVLMSMCIYIHTYSFISRLPISEKSCTSTLILFLRDHKECSNKHECACVSKVCWFKVPAYIPGHDIVLFLVCWQNSTVISTVAIQHTFHATVSLSDPSPHPPIFPSIHCHLLPWWQSIWQRWENPPALYIFSMAKFWTFLSSIYWLFVLLLLRSVCLVHQLIYWLDGILVLNFCSLCILDIDLLTDAHSAKIFLSLRNLSFYLMVRETNLLI